MRGLVAHRQKPMCKLRNHYAKSESPHITRAVGHYAKVKL